MRQIHQEHHDNNNEILTQWTMDEDHHSKSRLGGGCLHKVHKDVGQTHHFLRLIPAGSQATPSQVQPKSL